MNEFFYFAWANDCTFWLLLRDDDLWLFDWNILLDAFPMGFEVMDFSAESINFPLGGCFPFGFIPEQQFEFHALGFIFDIWSTPFFALGLGLGFEFDPGNLAMSYISKWYGRLHFLLGFRISMQMLGRFGYFLNCLLEVAFKIDPVVEGCIPKGKVGFG